jgi:hypothetical protein
VVSASLKSLFVKAVMHPRITVVLGIESVLGGIVLRNAEIGVR